MISVVMCTFNGEQFLAEQLESIAKQTRVPDEVVIADDGSTDATLSILRKWSTSVPFSVEIIEEPLQEGIAANFERALRRTAGDIVIFSDQDDVWHGQRVEWCYESLRNKKLGAVFSNARLIDEHGQTFPESLFDRLSLSTTHLKQLQGPRAFDVLLRRNIITGATLAVTRDLWLQAVPVPKSWLHDEWLGFVASTADCLILHDRHFIKYRVHGRNAVGAERPTLRYRLKRLVEPQKKRLSKLADRSADLLERWPTLEALNPQASPDTVRYRASQVAAKAVFEDTRSRLPRRRASRLAIVSSLAGRGLYRDLASRGNADILRDLLHKPE